MMLIPDVGKKLAKKYQLLTFALGWISPIVIVGLLFATVLANLPHLVSLSSVCFFLTFMVSIGNVFRLAYMVLGTRGEAHYFLTFWNMLDVFTANLLGNISVTMIIWNISRLTEQQQYKLSTPTVSAWFALLQLGTYTINLMCGAGIVREEPITLMAEFFVAPQTALNLVVLILIVAPAAIAALGIHTDEKPGEDANETLKK